MKQDGRNWIALYTRPRSERIVAEQLSQHGIEIFLPLREEVHQWSDRRKVVTVPLITSYVFAYLHHHEYSRVFVAHGIVRVIRFHGRVAVIRSSEIELLQRSIQSGQLVSVLRDYIPIGYEVKIINGPLTGHHGRIIRMDKQCRISIRIEELEYSLVVEVPAASVVPLSPPVIK